MRLTRIHVDQRLSPGAFVTLSDQAAAHLTRVLRLQTGDRVTLFNGDGHEYDAQLDSVGKQSVHVRITGQRQVDTSSPLHLTLAQSVARGDKMDWIVQKAIELGVACIVPLLSERTEVKLAGERAQRRLAHWQGIVVGACEQSGRTRLPTLEPIQSLEHWLAGLAPSGGLRLVLSPGSRIRLRDLRPLENGVTVAIGPEGGYSDRDLDRFRQCGFEALSLGPRILRTETAGVAVLAALQAIWGDL